jgi:uncharacterized protein YjbI with pentapeptide repeats
MSPPVVAAIIAGCFGVVTVISTLAVQLYVARRTSRDTEGTLEQQGKHLDRTLAEQREQLDTTLKAQSDQLKQTLAEQRTRTLNERFTTAAEQLGSDKPAVRLAGVYAMAGLADDWEENRQTCVDVLCAYLRMPYEPDPGHDAPERERLAFGASREVRHTVIRVTGAHLRNGAAVSWQGLKFDFTGVVFDGGDFSDATFSGEVGFSGAKFSAGEVRFYRAKFPGGEVDFSGTDFSGGEVGFVGAEFSGGAVDFSGAEFSGGDVVFSGADFTGCLVFFAEAEFSGGEVSFSGAKFSGGDVYFSGAEFSGGAVDFRGAKSSGGVVDFGGAKFSGGEVDFSQVADWPFPPFSWRDTPPPGVKLPKKEDQSQAQGSAG